MYVYMCIYTYITNVYTHIHIYTDLYIYIHTYSYIHFHAHLDAHIAAATLLRPLVQRIVNHIMAFWYVLCACEVVCPQTQPHNTSEQKCANGVCRHVKCANIRAATQGECAWWNASMSRVVASSSADRIGLWRACLWCSMCTSGRAGGPTQRQRLPFGAVHIWLSFGAAHRVSSAPRTATTWVSSCNI